MHASDIGWVVDDLGTIDLDDSLSPLPPPGSVCSWPDLVPGCEDQFQELPGDRVATGGGGGVGGAARRGGVAWRGDGVATDGDGGKGGVARAARRRGVAWRGGRVATAAEISRDGDDEDVCNA